MKRDIDLVRNILLDIESKDDGNGDWLELDLQGIDRSILIEHLMLMDDAGLIEGTNTSTQQGRNYQVFRLAWAGHDSLESIRDDEIWTATKKGAEEAGGFTVNLLKALAKGFINKKLEIHFGVELDI